jgi:hypothetical protein
LIADGFMRFTMKNERPMQRKRPNISKIMIMIPDKKELVPFLYVFLKKAIKSLEVIFYILF